MFRKIAISAVSALAILTGAASAAEEKVVQDFAFSFEGPFGTYDTMQLQRGLQVYTEVCAACHGMKFVPIRTLGDEGGPHLPVDQVRAYAKQFTVIDSETGEERPGLPTDFFPANTSAGAPDLSVMAKARKGFEGPVGLGINQILFGIGGPEYIASILTGFTGEEKEEFGNTFYGNHAFPGGWIKMPSSVLSDGQVEFADGAPNDLAHEAQDVAAFLMWAAEPKMMARKQAGFTAVLFLVFLGSLLYLTNKRLWSGIKGKKLH
jgi:ubiquinol-cytochrome c reductase cytochrome c1 subunit